MDANNAMRILVKSSHADPGQRPNHLHSLGHSAANPTQPQQAQRSDKR